MTQPEADQILLNVANDRLKAICLALGGSETRVPYTHHHDYIRSRWPSHLSRSDVAQMAQAMGMERLHWASLAHVAEDAEPMALLSLDQEEPEVIITTYNPWRLYRAIQSHLVMASIVMADWYLNDLLATHRRPQRVHQAEGPRGLFQEEQVRQQPGARADEGQVSSLGGG